MRSTKPCYLSNQYGDRVPSGAACAHHPVGFTEDGLPVGMELLGEPLTEARMLKFAQSV